MSAPELLGLTLDEWAEADRLIYDLTIQRSFATALRNVAALRPDASSLRMLQTHPEHMGEWARLADFYDRAQQERGSSLRAARP